MKNKLIIITISFLLISVCLSGCNENSNKINMKKNFLGSWNGTSYYLNITNNITLRFYNDDTAKQEDEHAHVHWFNYEVDEECLKLILPELPSEYAICYDYEFSNNNTSLTLINETLDIIILNKQ